MQLKHLELQGYKSFATKTEFLFDNGITAIVGPNGGGKSNIADAVRWVLGEQSYGILRAKRTEDMIFSGSEARARLGMAQAALTLDNSEGWLPVEFSEVTIARRAYRSGENEYLINGSRVRLRDVNELLATAGLSRRTYTVIGQGLVDTALSLRPTERRALFEEAAGITIHQAKRNQAIAKLEATGQNLLRVHDIINEISPRLRRLERQAGRAREYAQVVQELEGTLRIWYGYQWQRTLMGLRGAREQETQQRIRLDEYRAEMAKHDQRIADLRALQNERRRELSEWHRQSSALHSRAEEVQREMAICQERQRMLDGQSQELSHELVPLGVNYAAQQERIAEVEAELAHSETERQERLAQVQAAQERLEARESQRRALLEELTTARNRAFDLATNLADRRNRLDQLDERRQQLATEQADHQRAVDEHRQRLRGLRSRVEALARQRAQAQHQLRALAAQRDDRERQTQESVARQASLQAGVDKIQRHEHDLNSRYEMLSRLREEGAGYYAGVKNVLSATGDKLNGVVGVLASLVKVPPDLERATAEALGSHLQDIVVERWQHAEAAIHFLKQTRGGRATFLPLDTVRPGQPLRPPQTPGIVGLASELVECKPRLRAVVDLLLGRTLVVEDLKAARRAFDALSGGFQIVTRVGEILRSSGAVSGGTGKRGDSGGLLARERELRELPEQLAALRQQRTELEKRLRAELDRRQTLQAETDKLEDGIRQLRAADENRAAELDSLQRQAERLDQEVEWRQTIIEQLSAERQALDGREALLKQEMVAIEADVQTGEERIQGIQREIAALTADELPEELSQAKTALAVAEQSQNNRRAILRSHQANLTQLKGQIEVKRERIEQLETESQELSSRIERLSQQEATLSESIRTVDERIAPAEAELGGWEQDQIELEEKVVRQRTRLHEYESAFSQASLGFQRRRDELVNLRRQIEEDLGLVEMEATNGLAEQRPLPLKSLVTSLPKVDELPDGLEDELKRLKPQARRMSSVNPEAPAEYEAALERHTFLTTQVADLEQAAASLRTVIDELNQLMEREFKRTFDAVAAEFKQYFTTLFGGGTAELLLTEPDNLTESGIEIVARPPGKRQQSLALLSGGERALTAAALIFSILKVSPTPFCILDEVDAMLDETNVGRFRETLTELSQHTQFIIVTHNRGTIEAANTIYGVSMGADSVSKVISLKIDGEMVSEV